MRTMTKGDLKLDVVEHIMLRNMWEYFVISDKGQNDWVSNDPDIAYAVVMGFETELGCISLSEIEPHIVSRTKNLEGIMPANGYEWEEKVLDMQAGIV